MTLDQTPPNVHRVHPFLLLAVDCPMVSLKGEKGKKGGGGDEEVASDFDIDVV